MTSITETSVAPNDTDKEDVFRFSFHCKYFVAESIFVAKVSEVGPDLNKYHNYSPCEMFWADYHHGLDYINDAFYDNPVTDYITRCHATPDQIKFIQKFGAGPNVVEYIQDYGEISSDIEDVESDEESSDGLSDVVPKKR